MSGADGHRGAGEVFVAFLWMGLRSFGGPIAHVGYFHDEFVTRRAWLDDHGFAQRLALCQGLPGPASSQLGFLIGRHRAGWPGALAAFAGFTLPSALLMFAASVYSASWASTPWGRAVLHGLALAAVAVVAQGVVQMSRTLTPDLPRRLVAALACALALARGPYGMWLALGAGLLLGGVLPQPPQAATTEPALRAARPWAGLACLALFGVALVASLAWPAGACTPAALAAAFYRSGALVFGGGHVVLPLLDAAVVAPGWVERSHFMAGYAAAQAVPGPMFSFAAYLGADAWPAHRAAGALLALLSLFAPGLLLVAGVSTLDASMLARPAARRAMAGLNVAVVGLLAAALYRPLLRHAVHDAWDVAVVAVGVLLAMGLKRGAPVVLAACVAAAAARAVLAV